MVEIMKMMLLLPFLLLHAESVEGFEFRLFPTNSQGTEGFVELFHNGEWGSIGIAEFRFSDYTATLLCRKFNISLLFGHGVSLSHQENKRFSDLWLQKLECKGDERSIDECVNTDELRYRIPYYSLRQTYGSKLYCKDYKLIGGLSPNTGMLLAAFNNTQHSMCYQAFDSNAGDVVCKHLRYNGLVAFTEGDPGSIPLFNNKLTCTGNESSLNECTMSNAVIENCTRAVYITCKDVRLTRWDEYNKKGTVEIFYNGSWGHLDSGFNGVTAKLLCETFGFRNVGFSMAHRYLTTNIGKGWFGYLSCNGTETDIMQCGRSSYFQFVPYFSYNNRIFGETWLYCVDLNITSIRLVNGSNPNEGNVELLIGGIWGRIVIEGQKNTSQVKNVGSVVCKMLGYVSVSEILDPFLSYVPTDPWMSNLSCNGSEIALTDCSYTIGGCISHRLAVKCEDTDQCQSNPCLNNGTCVDGDRSYTCNCTERWSGINCEIDTDPCQSNPCLNNGTCVDGDRSYTCTCTERWSGINCEIDIDECLSAPCENNGNCTDSTNRYICSCVQGYGGERCQIDIDECLSQPCENNGACVNKINGFVCYCDQGYEGYRCQNEVGDQTTLIVVLISTICVLSIVVLATVCCCIRYRREDKKTKSDASNVLNSGKGGLQNNKKVEEEGQCNDVDYEEIKENTLDCNADYINDVTDVEQPKEADGYVEFADNDQNVGYYKLKHTKNEEYSKLSGCEF